MNLEKDLYQQLSVDREKYIVLERNKINLRSLFLVFFWLLAFFFIGLYCGYSANTGFLNLVELKPKMPDVSEILLSISFALTIFISVLGFQFFKRLVR